MRWSFGATIVFVQLYAIYGASGSSWRVSASVCPIWGLQIYLVRRICLSSSQNIYSDISLRIYHNGRARHENTYMSCLKLWHAIRQCRTTWDMMMWGYEEDIEIERSEDTRIWRYRLTMRRATAATCCAVACASITNKSYTRVYIFRLIRVVDFARDTVIRKRL